MKANIKNMREGRKVASNRKEKAFSHQYTLCVVVKGDVKEVMQARIYSTNSRNYACVWISSTGKTPYASGGGYAGGYGYHRASAALSNALDDAGITLSEAIDGRGESAMEESLTAIGKALGYRKMRIIRAHA